MIVPIVKTVIASGFNPLVFEVELAPKELKQYSLFDPDAAFVYGCYYEYRKRGADYFQQGMYQEAREQYATARNVPTVRQTQTWICA